MHIEQGIFQTSRWYPGINYDLRHGRFVETVSWKVSWNCWERYKVETCINTKSTRRNKETQIKGTMFRGSQEEGILSLVFARILSRRSGVLQTGPQGKTSLLGSLHEAPWRHMLPACSWSCSTLPGSHGSTCYGLLILWPGMWPNGQSTMMQNCIIWCAMSTQVYRNVWLDGLATNLMIYHYPYSLMRILQVVHKPWDQHLGLICTYRGNKPASRCLEAANGRDA